MHRRPARARAARRARVALRGGANDPDFVAFVETTTLVFFTYVLYDAFHLALEFPDLGSYDMAAHHVGFLVAAALAYAYGAYPLTLGWLCTCETSTPVLSTRWFVRQMKDMEYAQPGARRGGESAGDEEPRAGRRGTDGVLDCDRVLGRVRVRAEPRVRVEPRRFRRDRVAAGEERSPRRRRARVRAVDPRGLSLAGFCLNLMWVHKIVSMAMSEKKRKWLRKDAEQ